MMRIGFGCDHVSLELKKVLMEHVSAKGIEIIDFGAYQDINREHYPEYGLKVAQAIIEEQCDLGIIVCGTGVGISISANKVPGIRAAVCSEPYSARLSRQHNNTNILAMGSRVVGTELAKMIVDEWLNAQYEGGRHQVRLDMIEDIERKYKA
jgi:ribose 5-phosphate isomerase B